MSDTVRSAEQEGYDAAMAGATFGSNPYSDVSLQLCQAWSRGFQRGEVSEGEVLGHFRDRTGTA